MDKEDVVYVCVCACIHIYTNRGILFIHKKERNSAICSNTDEPEGHYAKGNKPDGERQIPRGATYTWNLKYIYIKPIS